MRIKTFEAPTMQEALSLAKRELGEEAVVLNTKYVKSGGLLGLRGSSKVELMAATDDAPAPMPAAQAMQIAAPTEQPAMAAVQVPAAFEAPQVSVQAMGSLAARLYGAAPAGVAEPDPEVAQLRSELRELSSIVRELLATSPAPAQFGGCAAERTHLKPLILRLGVDEDIARGLLGELLSIDDPMSLTSALAARMQGFALPPALDDRRVIALVGPTGVGKTTTLAKLAAKFSLEQGKKVALVTADTFRIGAVEQLRTYARIMGVPLEIALSPEEVAGGIEKHQDKDVVLIDTVGRSQRSGDHLSELKSFLDAAGQVETHLVISASLSTDVQREVAERFAMFSPTRLIVTKLDESPNRGCLVNIPLRMGLGISCVTAGQNVPQDIDLAEAGKIARLVTEVA